MERVLRQVKQNRIHFRMNSWGPEINIVCFCYCSDNLYPKASTILADSRYCLEVHLRACPIIIHGLWLRPFFVFCHPAQVCALRNLLTDDNGLGQFWKSLFTSYVTACRCWIMLRLVCCVLGAGLNSHSLKLAHFGYGNCMSWEPQPSFSADILEQMFIGPSSMLLDLGGDFNNYFLSHPKHTIFRRGIDFLGWRGLQKLFGLTSPPQKLNNICC